MASSVPAPRKGQLWLWYRYPAMSLSSLSLLCTLPLVEITRLLKRPDKCNWTIRSKAFKCVDAVFSTLLLLLAPSLTMLHHCCQNWRNSPLSTTMTQRKTFFRIRFKNLKYSLRNIWEIHFKNIFPQWLPKLGEFPAQDNDSTVFLLVLGKWCTAAPMHRCT